VPIKLNQEKLVQVTQQKD